jgi:hypothetical protein
MAQPTTTPKLGGGDGKLILVPPGKLRCYVHGVLRKETPEEHVRQRVARSLVEEYGYAKSDLHIEFPIKLGSARKRADIAVFPLARSTGKRTCSLSLRRSVKTFHRTTGKKA